MTGLTPLEIVGSRSVLASDILAIMVFPLKT